MEMTFYDDTMYRSSNIKSDGKSSLKRPATLDLDSPDTLSKKQQRLCNILTSPDLHMLKLASPELERFIISNGNITTTPTPTNFLFSKNVTEEQEQYARGFIDALNQLHQTQFQMGASELIARISTGTTPVSSVPSSEFPQGTTVMSSPTLSKLYGGLAPFYLQPATSVIKKSPSKQAPKTDAPQQTSVLQRLSDQRPVEAPVLHRLTDYRPAASESMSLLVVRPPSVDSNSCNSMSSSSTQPLEILVKEEYQTVPGDFSSPPASPIGNGPIDMKDQERIKLERKRYRNRVAASKCRKRKLEKISHLEDKVKELKGENSKLEMTVEKLREQVCFLKQEVLDHAKKGCQIYLTKQ
ncbi:hypothetical protein JTE90_013900 [Oedothorax gibbosus]|uniref:BZIP domain-containing protein n=1 Tax=Oedothorax gibbosus TaxID=931172 RepID=A0AAV6VH77_9ARAC|nr:hypothetical protein JTE90_013900 [Oedothorax gibbosus]